MRAARRPGSIEDRLLLVSVGIAVIIFAAGAVVLTRPFGSGALWFAAIPLFLSLIVAGLLAVSRVSRQWWPRMVGLVLCLLVALVIVSSFVVIAFALLPSCAILAVACLLPSDGIASVERARAS